MEMDPRYARQAFPFPRTMNSPISLSLNSGNLIFDTEGSWRHSSGLRGKGSLEINDYLNAGQRWRYAVCTFQFTDLSLGSGVDISVEGANSLRILVDHNVSIGTNLRLNGESGSQGIYAGSAGSGGWISGKGLRNTDLFSNVHPSLNGSGPGGGRGYEIGKSTGGGSYGGSGTGGLNGGVPGLIYGDESITHLIGGSGGGHAIRGSGNAGGGGGALGITAGEVFGSRSEFNYLGKWWHGNWASRWFWFRWIGRSDWIQANSILNYGKIEALGGDALGSSSLGGAGGGGRIALLAEGTLLEGTPMQVVARIKPCLHLIIERMIWLVIGHWMKIRLQVLLTITPLSQD